MIYWKTY